MDDVADALTTALRDRYRIDRLIGEGGMAQVYLARDLRHDRNVALKVLKPELAAMVGAERFLSEIRTTANLQHPHILALHDSGEAAGFLYYVMPYIEGESLRERLAREHQLPVDEAVRIAGLVAGALQYAHDQGVIHRDIKPANILLSRGQPVVADFGIALAVTEAGGGRLTETGLSLGTPHYMSPEQATGEQTVGPATDIYALGCVLYEMLVGEPPYTGCSAQAVLGKIITAAPAPITDQRKSVPANVNAAVTMALEKLPADRFTSADTFARALADPSFRHGADAAAAGAIGETRWRAVAAGMAAATLVLAIVLVWLVTRPEPPREVARFVFPFATDQMPDDYGPNAFSLAPDGTFLVYRGQVLISDAGRSLRLRRWDDLDAAPIPGADGAGQIAISPDGREVAFQHLNAIKVRSLEGGGVRTLVPGEWPIWGPDGMIYASIPDGVVRVSPTGGEPDTVLALPDGDASIVITDFMPAGAALVHVETTGGASEIRVWWPETGETRSIGPGTWPRYAESGHLLYIAEDASLVAEPFDIGTMTSAGSGRRILGPVAAYSLSDNGHLVYTTQGATGDVDDVELVWLTRSGEVSPVESGWRFDRGGIYFGWRLSPEDGRIAFARQVGENVDIYVKNIDSGTQQRLTFADNEDWVPWWRPDGQSVTYVRRQEPGGVWSIRADGTGEPTAIVEAGEFAQGAWSPDGTWLVLRSFGAITAGAQGTRSIAAFRPGVDSAVIPLIATDYVDHAPAISPDGNWLAYASNATGEMEVHVRPFPNVDDGNVPVSTNGGTGPIWSRDGTELFYVRGDTMVAAQVELDPSFRVTDQRSLFEIPQEILSVGSSSWVDGQHFYDVSQDGRFLMGRRVAVPESEPPSFVLVMNFVEELKERGR